MPRPRSISPAWAVLATLWPSAVALAQKPATKPSAAEAPAGKVDPVVDQLVEAHNRERAKEELPALKLRPKLTAAALVQAKDMAEHAFMGHEGSDDSTPEQRVVREGYRYLRTGENVAAGYKGVAEVVQVWMESPGHRKNILGDFREMGAALAFGKDDKPYWCVTFGTPMPKLDPAEAAADLVKRLNEGRDKAKLPALSVDERLAKAAQEKAAALAKIKSQGGGTASFEGIDQRPYSELAMSTANGHPDAPAMAKVILEDDKLKDQVLGKFSRIGVGYATSEDGVPYWCIILGTPATPVKSRTTRSR